MVIIISREDLEAKLANENLYHVLSELSDKAKVFKGGGAHNHRIFAMGCLASTFAEKIERREAPKITRDTTFGGFRKIDPIGYSLTLDFLKPLFDLELYKLPE